MGKVNRIFLITFIIVAIFLLSVCSKKKPPEPEPPQYKWTILGYFDGNNSQDQAPDGQSYVIKDLQELEQIGSTEEVQILVMLGSFKTEGKCKYYHVKTDSSEEVLDLSEEDIDMSDHTTLGNFIKYGIQNFPAEHYMLIINDHGAGWKGVCSDTINGDGSWMSLPELSSALSEFKFDIIDIIWFYTPSLATVEVAYQVEGLAEYMIASQFKWHPDNIMGSSEWLPYLSDNLDRVYPVAMTITKAIYNAAQKVSPYKHVHSVLIHLPKISQLATDVSNLSRDLIDSTGLNWGDVWAAWATFPHIYDQCDSVFVDLRQFAREIQTKPNLDSAITKDAMALEISVNEAVVADTSYPDYDEIGGISIHLPWNQDDFDPTNYTQLDFSTTGWHNFVSVFIQSFSGSYAGALNIMSKPTGAKVFLNGGNTGDTTNVLIGGLLPGDHTVKLVKSGYRDWIEIVTIYPQQTTAVLAILKQVP